MINVLFNKVSHRQIQTLCSLHIDTFNQNSNNKMVRGRPMNTALPETRGLVQQRKFRAKKAEKIVRPFPSQRFGFQADRLGRIGINESGLG